VDKINKATEAPDDQAMMEKRGIVVHRSIDLPLARKEKGCDGWLAAGGRSVDVCISRVCGQISHGHQPPQE